MNKGLESFVKLQSLLKELITTITLDQALILGENIDIIETELKRLEELEKVNSINAELYTKLDIENQTQDEILRIIKEKEFIHTGRLKRAIEEKWSYEQLVENHKTYCISLPMLTQAEFDLLKGYFK